jgi:hypothetical protein
MCSDVMSKTMVGKGKPQIIDRSSRVKQHPINSDTSHMVKPVSLLNSGPSRSNYLNMT